MVTEAQRIICESHRPLRHLSDGLALWTTYLSQRGYSPSTIYGYRLVAKHLIDYDHKPDLLSIEAYLSSLRDNGISVNTLIQHVKAIKSFFGFLEYHALWPSNPAQYLLYPKVEHRERSVPSTPVVRTLFSQELTLKERLILSLFVDTGLRVMELASLRLDCIKLADREITVIGKGSKERLVPFSVSTRNLLQRYMPRVARAQEGKSPQWLFPSRRADSSKGHVVVASFQRMLTLLCESAGVGHLSPHQLRHYWATYQLKDGADVKIVSKTLGHVSVATTLDIYHHVDLEDIKLSHDKHSPLKALQTTMKWGVNDTKTLD